MDTDARELLTQDFQQLALSLLPPELRETKMPLSAIFDLYPDIFNSPELWHDIEAKAIAESIRRRSLIKRLRTKGWALAANLTNDYPDLKGLRQYAAYSNFFKRVPQYGTAMVDQPQYTSAVAFCSRQQHRDLVELLFYFAIALESARYYFLAQQQRGDMFHPDPLVFVTPADSTYLRALFRLLRNHRT